METYEIIKMLREQRGLSQEALADMVGYKDRSSIAKIESGLVDLAQSKIAAFADAFGVTPAYIIGFDGAQEQLPAPNIIPLPTMKQVPLLGTIACGEPILAAENLDGYVKMPEQVHADFALRCKGDSMSGARINDGDIVFIAQCPDVDNGTIAAVIIDDEATLKRVYKSADKIILQPENPRYQPLVYVGEELNDIRILGRAVAFLSAVN